MKEKMVKYGSQGGLVLFRKPQREPALTPQVSLMKRGIMADQNLDHPDYTGGPQDSPPIDFPHLGEYTFSLRHIEKILPDGEDSSIRLACRAQNGSKVWININGLSIGMILDAILKGRG